MTAPVLAEKDYAFLGSGIIAGVFAERMVNAGIPAGRLHVSDVDPGKAKELERKLGVRAARDNREAAAAADVVFLCVPPQAVKTVMDEVRAALRPNVLLVSLAAAVRTEWIEQSAGGAVKVLRVIPNTPSLIGAGMNPHCLGRHVTEADLAFIDALLGLFGTTVRLREDQMEAFTALTAVGPTYVFPIIQALRDAAAGAGVEKQAAERAAAQTVLGAAQLVLQTGRGPEDLIQMIGTRTLAEDAARDLFRQAYETALGKLRQAVQRLSAPWQQPPPRG